MEPSDAISICPSPAVNTLVALQEEWKREGYFHEYTKDWLQRRDQIQTNEYKRLVEKDAHSQRGGRLKDGELLFGDEDDDTTPTEPDPALAEGCVVPKQYGKCPKELLGKPLAEIDPYIVLKKKSFIVINQRFKNPYLFRFSASRAFFVMSPFNRLRRFCVLVNTNQFFDYFMIVAIAINCVLLALDSRIENAEYFFLAVYVVEAFVKLMARGFIVNSYTYLRDVWNWLDILILGTSVVFLFLELLKVPTQSFKVSVLRTFRVFRALRTISIVPSLRTIVNALIKSFRMLIEVMGLTFFCMTVFSLFCIQVYHGVLHQKCVQAYNATRNISYSDWIADSNNWGQDSNNDPLVCGNASTAGHCGNDSTYVCLNVGPNPNYGYTHFDNYGWSMLNMLQLLTLDYWEQIYNKIIRASGSWNVVFFIIVVFFGSFYLVNLMLAVVTMFYEEEAGNSEVKNAQGKPLDVLAESKRHKLASRPSSVKDPNGGDADDLLDGEDAAFADLSSPETLAVVPEEGDTDKEQATSLPHDDKTTHAPVVDPADKAETQSNGGSNDGTENDEEEEGEGEGTEESPRKRWKDKINCYCCSLCCISYPTWVRFQTLLRKVVQAKWFEITITICIILTTLVMAADHYQMPEWMSQLSDKSNYVFSAVFILEAILKLLCLTKSYFKSKWNIFDLVIVIVSIIDMSVQDINGLQVIRLFRLLRIFKLAQSWTTMRTLLAIITSSLAALGNLTIVLGIIIFTFALMGRELFQDDYQNFYLNASSNPPSEFNGQLPRFNFNDFFHAFLMIFRILCGEWAQPLWECMIAAGDQCVVVFMPALIVGRLMVLNLFLALLLNSFEADSLNKKDEASGPGILARLKLLLKRICCRPCCRGAEVKPEVLSNQSDSRPGSAVSILHKHDATMDGPTLHVPALGAGEKAAITANGDVKGGTHEADPRRGSRVSLRSTKSRKRRGSRKSRRSVEEEEKESEKAVDIRACFCSFCCVSMNEKNSPSLRRFNTFRRAMKRVADHKVFEGVVLVCILVSSVMLTLNDANIDNPENATLSSALYYMNVIFTVIFTLEMLIKWAGHGLRVYFTNAWSLLDFTIVVISVVSTVLESMSSVGSIGFLRVMRTFRALRPLRAISRWEGMRVVVNALANSIPSIVNVVIVCLVFWLIFAILGVQFFKGRFYKCVDENSTRLDADIVPNKSVCFQLGYNWTNSRVNFDDTISAYLALFQVATFEGWMEVMADAVDSRGDDDLQPYREASIYWYIFFVGFIIFGSFFTLNLFIGVVIDNFNVLKKKYEGDVIDVLMTVSQRKYYKTVKRLTVKKPQKTIQRPKSSFLAFFYDVACSNRFEMAVLFLILINMIIMTTEHDGQPQIICLVLYYSNIVFTTVFALEAVVKLLGMRQHYFRRPWNVFDFLVVIISIVSIILDALSSDGHCEQRDETSQIPINPTIFRVMRIFRVGRVLRLVTAAKGIRKLLFALFVSLPALFNVAALLFLIMFIYAIVGMTLFMNAPRIDSFDDQVNFETFPNSMMVLFRITTSAGWNDILDTIVHGRSQCVSNCPPDAIFIIIYFLSYLVICFMMIINMYIAILLENFNQAHQQEEIGITEDDFEAFYIAWEKYDPFASQFILMAQLTDIVAELEPPLGIPKPNEIAIVALDLPIVEGERVHCLDALHALTRHALGHVEETESFKGIQKNIDLAFMQQFPVRVNIRVLSTTMRRKKEDVAARTLQNAWKQHKLKKRMQLLEAHSSRTPSRLVIHRLSTAAPSSVPSKSQPSSPRSERRPSVSSRNSSRGPEDGTANK